MMTSTLLDDLSRVENFMSLCVGEYNNVIWNETTWDPVQEEKNSSIVTSRMFTTGEASSFARRPSVINTMK